MTRPRISTGAVVVAALVVLAPACAAPVAQDRQAAPSAVATTSPTSVSGPSLRSASESSRTSSPVTGTTSQSSAKPAGSSFDPSSRPALGTSAHPVKVGASGQVLIDRQGAVVVCPPHDEGGVGVATPPVEEPTPDCPNAIPTNGFDAKRLYNPHHNSTHRWGTAYVEGQWDGARLRITLQRQPTRADDTYERLDDTSVPCPEPANGWKIGPTQEDPNRDKIPAAVGARFAALAMGYPKGLPKDSTTLADATQVVVVGTTGDVAVATAAIRRVFTGNLCVVKARNAEADLAGQQSGLREAFIGSVWQKLGITSWGESQVPLGNPVMVVNVGVDSAELREIVDKIPGPTIGISAWLRPVP